MADRLEDIARPLARWHCGAPKGREELRAIADRHGVDYSDLFDEVVKQHDRERDPCHEPSRQLGLPGVA